ncbi:bcl2-associated agonist of cell death [Ascaphus truei]|uniref:bcl2-associated agonist of cell death n=1 Tax=Ascaphus truei TaxID=8439 RepID=UPI003F5AB596
MTESPPSSMFSIAEFDLEEQEGALPCKDLPRQGGSLGHSDRSSPDLRRKQRGKEKRSRAESHSDSSETSTPDETQGFRLRSRSAPSALLVAARYGRELRRMSDEFDQTFQGLPRPKSANAAGQLTVSKSFREMCLSLWGLRKSKPTCGQALTPPTTKKRGSRDPQAPRPL